MPGEYPVIKFSPFEALLIGEKNKIAKRKPMKNTIFVTCLNNQKKTFDLRALFDVKDSECENESPKRREKFLMNKHKLRHVKNGNTLKCKTKPNREVYFFECEDSKVIVKNNELAKMSTKNKKNQSNKVRFKRDFKFKETLEERIVHKIQKRKKNLKTNLIKNRVLSQIEGKKWKRHSIRGKDGKFIRKEEHDQLMREKRENKTKRLTKYLKHLYIKKGNNMLRNSDRGKNGVRLNESFEDGHMKKKTKLSINKSDNVLNDLSKQYYENYITKELLLPPLPDLTFSDFDDDTSLLDILCECQPDGIKKVNDSDAENSDIIRRRKGLKMYERKKSVNQSKSGIREVLNNSMKENHCVVNRNVNINNLENLNESNIILKGRRNGLNYLIDERPTNDNHLLSQNTFRSLFYKTACGTETYLGNIIKPVLLNSPFGRLPDIS